MSPVAQNFVSLPPKAIHSIHTSLASVAGLTDILLVIGQRGVKRLTGVVSGGGGRDQLSSDSPAVLIVLMSFFVHTVLILRKTVALLDSVESSVEHPVS